MHYELVISDKTVKVGLEKIPETIAEDRAKAGIILGGN